MNEVLQAVWAIAPGIIVGGSMTAGLAGYFCKAGFENVKKIKNSINERGV